jgi:hypothetical protein
MKMKYFAIILCTFAFFANLQSFEWQDNGVPVRQGVNIEWSRAGATLEDGSAIYVWSDTQNGDRDVFAQRVSADGNTLWDSPVLVDGKVDRQEDPVVISTSDNHVIVAWIDFSNQIAGDVYAQKINADGELQWATGGVEVCVADGEQISLNIVPDDAGGAYIIWLDSRNSGGTDIYGMHVGSDGNMMWADNGIAVADNDGSQTGHTFWEDGVGGAVMAYVNSYDNNSDIYITRMLSDGTQPWGAFVAAANSEDQEEKVKMAHLSDNKFAIAWRQRNEDNNVGFINTRVVDLDGNMTDAQIVCDADGGQLDPRLTADVDGSYFVAWQDRRNNSQVSDIFIQKCNNSGVPQWADDGVLVCDAEFNQNGQRAIADGDGGCYVIWDDTRSGIDSEVDIYIQHFNSSGVAKLDANGLAVCDAPLSQSKGLIRKAGENIFIVWMDIRNGSVGLYYQVFNNDVAQLDDNGNLVFWGLSGDSVDHQTFVKGTDTYISWLDTRSGQSKVFIQKLDESGNADFATNGIEALDNDYTQIEQQMSASSSDGAFLGIVQRISGIEYAYGASIDGDGSRLWGDEGVALASGGDSQINIQVDAYNSGALYGFSKMEGSFPFLSYKLYAQYVENGAAQWGDAGKLILDLGADVNLTDMVGDVFIVESDFNIYAQRVDSNGDIYDGWAAEGLVISDAAGIQKNPKAISTDQGIFVNYYLLVFINSIIKFYNS